MNDEVVLRVENVGKSYVLTHHANGSHTRYRKFSDALVNSAKSPFHWLNRASSIQPQASREEFWALKNVSFEVRQGDMLGIIGRNGSGKSTLLKILSRITAPTEGRVTILGRLAALLEVGTGFHPELTGRENIFLNGAIHGLRKSEITAQFDQIVDFAEVENFLDTPVKRYSSGMYVRLAFSVAAHLHSDLLLVDEVLAVGDAAFQKKCLRKVGDISRHGRTVLFVSHNMGMLSQFCRNALVLESGRVLFQGGMKEGIAHYLGKSQSSPKITPISVFQHSNAWGGAQKIRLDSVELCDSPFASFTVQWKQPITLRLHITVLEQSHHVYFGLTLSNAQGMEIFGSHHNDTGAALWDLVPGQHHIDIRIENPLRAGLYTLAFGASTALGGGPIFRVADAVALEVLDLAADGTPYPQYDGGPINGVASWSHRLTA